MFQSLRLLLCLSLCDAASAVIAKHCFTFEEHLLKDMDSTILCDHRPGRGAYAECNVSDFHTDLTEVRPEVRSLCIFHSAKLIPEKAFPQLPSLEFLRIFGEQLHGITADAFSGLSNLKYLKIISDAPFKCRNVSLEARAFAGLDQLQELELAGFQFKNIASSTFDPLTELVSLRLTRVCVMELSEVCCHLSGNLSHLQHLSLVDSGVLTISKQSCMAKSAVLAGVKVLNLDRNPIQVIDPDSLTVFQNLSSLSLEFYGQSVGSIWKSGIGQVSKVRISGQTSKKLVTDLEDLCHMIIHLSVRTLELYQIAAEMLSETSLQNCGKNLRVLNVWSSRIQQIDFGFWKEATKIKSLAMADMGLKEVSFCSAVNGTIWNITSLNLESNLLTEIHSNQFGCMPLLELLVLSNNSIEALLQDALSGLPRLRILKLNSNKITQLLYSDFESLLALEILLIDNNAIQKIEGGTFRKQKQLQQMTLGTVMSSELYLSIIFHGFPPKIQNLSIDIGPRVSLLHMGIASTQRPFALNLNIYNIYIDDCENPLLKSVQELKLKGKFIFCNSHSFWSFFTNLESFEYKGDAERESERYTEINTLHNLRRLKLMSLNLSNHTDPGMIFWNLKKLQILMLVNCRLNFLTKSMFKDLQSLQLLRMHMNNPLILLDGMFDALPSLRAIVLDKLDFHCDCENDWFLDWAESSQQVQVVHMQRQQCVWHYQKWNYLATMEKLCQTDVQYLCYLGTAITITLLLSASAGYRFAYWPCVVVFFRLRGYVERKLGRKWRIKRRRARQSEGEVEVEVEDEMKYDAFVSFSRHDEAWVLGELAPRLEQGQQRLRLCLHSRDFEVGKGIVDNIAESIYSSRRTVCVLSRQYLHSDWCGLEMRVATYRLLEEQEHRLILIFLEHMSPFELTAFHRLVTLVRSRTYLEWPEDLAKREHFWQCLRRNIVKGNMSVDPTPQHI